VHFSQSRLSQYSTTPESFIMKRLIATGRLISPFESESKEKPEDQYPDKMLPDI